MKKKTFKIMICALVALLTAGALLCGCGKKEEAPPAPVPTAEPTPQPTPVPTPVPTPAEPEWEPGIVRGADGLALYTTLQRGDMVNVVEELEDYYVLETEEGRLYVEKIFLRMDKEEAPEVIDGYSKLGTKVYATAYLEGEPTAELEQNTQIKRVDTKADWAYIEWDGGSGYIDEDQFSEKKIEKKKKKPSSGGGGGGAQDGGDIVLGAGVVSDSGLSYVLLTGEAEEEAQPFEMGAGTILSKDTEAYMYLYAYLEEAKVTEVGEEECTVYLGEGHMATMPRWNLRMEGDEEYAAWEGFAKDGATVYTNIQKRHEQKELELNTKVKVLDELPVCIVVEVDGEIGYMDLEDVSETEIVKKKKKPSSGGGGSSSGGGGGGGGGEWTPPAL